MEICVLSDMQLNSISEWQEAIDSEGFELRLSQHESFSDMKGFLPLILRTEPTGFECFHVSPRELIETYDNIQFGHEWKFAIELLWEGDHTQMQAACMAAAAYARATSGVVFDPQASQVLSAAHAFEMVQDNERFVSGLKTEQRNSQDQS